MTKRSTHDGLTVVYRYGCPSWAKLDDEAMRQLRLAHDLRNELVAIDRRKAELVAGVWGLHPEVAQAQCRVDAATVEVEGLAEQMRRDRIRNRSTVPVADAKAALKVARLARKEAKAAARAAKDAAMAEMRPLFAQILEARRLAIKALYATVVQAQGLHWATYNNVVAHYETAVQRVAEQRSQGRAADLQHHHWRGTGTLTVQLQRAAGAPQRTPALLASGEGPWRNVAQIGPWIDPGMWPRGRGKHRHGEVRLTLGRGRHLVLPVVLHRPMPADADVTDVRVTRRRVAGQYRLSVAVTVRLPKPAPVVDRGAAAVFPGWASVGDGPVGQCRRPDCDKTFRWVRVARVSLAGAVLPPPPADIAELVRVTVAGFDLHASPQWARLAHRDDHIRGVRDELLDELRPLVVEALAEAALSEAVGVSGADVSRWRSPRRFARLARRWPAGHPLAQKLRDWRLRDAHLWAYEAHERDQVTARRRDAWRKAAAWLCDAVGVVALHDIDFAELRQVPDVDIEDPHRDRHGRRNGQFAAPGDLVHSIEVAAQRRGVQLVYAEQEAGG